MGALNWLNRLRKNESGNIIAIGAAAMPMLVGTAAMAVDTIQLSLWKRQLQRTADSAAIAGAYSASQGGDVNARVEEDIEDNPIPDLGTTTITRGAWGTYKETVHVSLSTERDLAFMGMFTQEPATITAEARAALVGTGEYCMVSLYKGLKPGIRVTGNGSINLSCGMVTNSVSGNAVNTNGGGSISATPIAATGGLDPENNYTGEATQLLPYSAPQADPYAGVPDPDVPTVCATPQVITSGQTEIQAGSCYTGISVGTSDTLTIKGTGPVYILGGDVRIQGNLFMDPSSAGVTLVMTGNEIDPKTGKLKVGDLSMTSEHADWSLSPPATGDYKDLVFYRDRRANEGSVKITAGAQTVLEGGFYAASADIDLSGQADFTSTCLMMVAQVIDFTGGSTLTNTCDSTGGIKMIERTVVRLVA
jgi:hypothetical protein